jgi:hypothetical protein
MNGFKEKFEYAADNPIVRVPAYGENLFTKVANQLLSQRMAKGFPFSDKIDNFSEEKHIRNLCFSSIDDEEVLGFPEPVGVIQLFNRIDKNVESEDWTRLFYARKLLGTVI